MAADGSRIWGLPSRPTTRFAPSPTGFLHLGHVANAVWTWGVAQATGGRVLLRLEDHDRGRCRPEYERRILADLTWLGLETEPESRRSLDASQPSPFRQSDNGAVYQAAMDRLAGRGLVYACRCSRKDIARALGFDVPPDGTELPYPGTCRNRRLPSEGSALRVMLPEGAVRFTDLRHGDVTQVPAQQCGDLLLRDAAGNWTYQFAVVVDDLRHGVDLVIRGDDILASTGRQIRLGALLGRAAPPRYLHHPLIEGAVPGAKLSKRDGAAGLATLRDAGRTAADVLGEAAWRTGLLREPRPVPAGSLGELFQSAASR